MTIYGIPKQGKMKKAIRLIDAPGLGDTGGIMKDKENIEKIKLKIAILYAYYILDESRHHNIPNRFQTE